MSIYDEKFRGIVEIDPEFSELLSELNDKAEKWEEFEDFITVDILTKDGPIAFGNPIPLKELIGIRKKLEAIQELTESNLERSGRFWKVKMHLHPRHQVYISSIMAILESSEFNKNHEEVSV